MELQKRDKAAYERFLGKKNFQNAVTNWQRIENEFDSQISDLGSSCIYIKIENA